MTKFLKNADVTGYISQTSVTSSLVKTDSSGKLVAAVAGTDYATPGALASADKMVTIGRNATGATLYQGTVVYISGSTGNRPNFVKAQANGEATSAGTFGVVLADIPNNSDGNVVTIGAIDNLDTRSGATNPFTSDTLVDGDTIYLSPTTAGYITRVKPSAPNHIVYIGKVVRTSPTNGTIVYRIQNGYELDEIHDVAISSLANNHTLVWESATSLWKNKTIATTLGYTPADDSAVVKLTGDQTVAGVKTFTSVVNAPTLSLNGGVLAGNNIVSMRSNPTGGQFRIEKSDGSLSAYPFYIGADGTALAYYYNAAGALKVLLHTDGTSYFGNNLSVGYTTYAATTYKLDVNGTARVVGPVLANAPSEGATGEGLIAGQSFKIDATATGQRAAMYVVSNVLSDTYASGLQAQYANFAGDKGFGFNLNTAGGFELYVKNTSWNKALTIANTKAATFTDTVTATSFIKTGGTSVQFLKADGSVDSSTYLTSSSLSSYLPLSGGTLTGALSGTSATFSANVSASNFRVYNGATTGGYFIHKAGWVGSGTDYAPSIAAETTYGINFFTNGSASLKMYLATTGQLQLNTYTSATSYTGTAAGYLAFDSSGNVITLASVAATDSTKLPLAGGALTGPLSIAGTGTYLGDWGYSTLTLTDTGGYPGIFFKNGNNIWIMRRNGADNAMDWAYSTNASAQGTGTFTQKMRLASDEWWVSTYTGHKLQVTGGDQINVTNAGAATTLYLQYHGNAGGNLNIAASKFIFYNTGEFSLGGGSGSSQSTLASGLTAIRFPNQYSSGYTDAGVKLYIFNSGTTIQGFTAGPAYDLQYHSSGSDSGRHAFYVANSEIIRFSKTIVGISGILQMSTSGTSYISMGRFPNSTTNAGEAWLGRASDRSTGTMTVQLGVNNSQYFEVVDYAWTTVTLRVGMNDFTYKGNAVIHAGNIGSQSVSTATTASRIEAGNNQWTWSTGAHTATNPNSITLWDQYSTAGGSGSPETYGTILDIYGRSAHEHDQLMFGASGNILHRSCFYGTNTWGSWKIMLDESNAVYATTMNQHVGTSYGPTFADVYTNGWFRNNNSNQGLYSQPNNVHFYATSDRYWNIGSGGGSNGGLIFRQDHQTTLKGYVYWDGSGFGLLNNQGGWSVLCYQGTGYGGELRGSWTMAGSTIITSGSIGSQSVATSNQTYRSIIEDTRGGQRTPNDYDDYRVSWEFTNQIVSGWHSVMTLQGWHDGYAAWQIIGPSDSAHENWYLRSGNNTSWNSLRSIIHSGNIGSQTVSNSDMVDGYHASNFLGFQGNSYYQVNTWLQMNGTHGIYYPSYNGAHFYVNTTSSYTQFRLDGSRGGYGGIWDSYSAVHGIMYDSGGNGGVYREANGRWYWYYHLGNACMAIGNAGTSSSYVLYVHGAIYATGDVVAYSDSRKKTNVITVDNPIETITKMRGVFYDKIGEEGKGRQIGVIAQEVNEILPEAVTYASDIDEYGVKYGNMAGLFIEAIKEQQKQIEELKSIINDLTK